MKLLGVKNAQVCEEAADYCLRAVSESHGKELWNDTAPTEGQGSPNFERPGPGIPWPGWIRTMKMLDLA
jgi:glucose dehydrogenase